MIRLARWTVRTDFVQFRSLNPDFDPYFVLEWPELCYELARLWQRCAIHQNTSFILSCSSRMSIPVRVEVIWPKPAPVRLRLGSLKLG